MSADDTVKGSNTADDSTVEVLLATYNGSRYLRQQIESILEQSHCQLRILARDDGSTDDTQCILQEYAARLPNRFRVLTTGSKNAGAKWNFMHLMLASSAEYVALADQDDVWRREKLQSSIAAMRDLEQNHGTVAPLLVFTDLEIVDSDLRTLHFSFWLNQHIDPYRITSLPHLLAQNVFTGCTGLMNRSLVTRALSMPPEAFMHDWWIALMASVFGHAAVLPAATVQYRQHDRNVVGAAAHGKPNLIPKWRLHTLRQAQWEMCIEQAEGLLRTCRNDMTAQNRSIVEDFVSIEHTPWRVSRAMRFLRGGFFQKGLRPNLAMLWYLWDMKAAKRMAALGEG